MALHYRIAIRAPLAPADIIAATTLHAHLAKDIWALGHPIPGGLRGTLTTATGPEGGVWKCKTVPLKLARLVSPDHHVVALHAQDGEHGLLLLYEEWARAPGSLTPIPYDEYSAFLGISSDVISSDVQWPRVDCDAADPEDLNQVLNGYIPDTRPHYEKYRSSRTPSSLRYFPPQYIRVPARPAGNPARCTPRGLGDAPHLPLQFEAIRTPDLLYICGRTDIPPARAKTWNDDHEWKPILVTSDFQGFPRAHEGPAVSSDTDSAASADSESGLAAENAALREQLRQMALAMSLLRRDASQDDVSTVPDDARSRRSSHHSTK